MVASGSETKGVPNMRLFGKLKLGFSDAAILENDCFGLPGSTAGL
jgi:hypothetical protein